MANTKFINSKSKSTGNVGTLLFHPTFGRPAGANPKIRGPKKGTRSFNTAYRKLMDRAWLPAIVDPEAVIFPPRGRGKFNYPERLLTQAYFCRGGDGTWRDPSLSLSMLVNEKFVSPIGELLDQLKKEGHDVGGARLEWLAFREIASRLHEDIKSLSNGLDKLQSRWNLEEVGVE